MNKRYVLYILIGLMFIMPILAIEDIVPWVTSLLLIHKSIKSFKDNNSLKPVVKNTIIAGIIIFIYNFGARYVQEVLSKMWL